MLLCVLTTQPNLSPKLPTLNLSIFLSLSLLFFLFLFSSVLIIDTTFISQYPHYHTFALASRHTQTSQQTPNKYHSQHQKMLFYFFLTLFLTIANALPTQNSSTTSPSNPTLPPPWLQGLTYPLLCYDLVLITIYIYAWVAGWFWWMRRQPGATRDVQIEMREWRGMYGGAGTVENVEVEMRRVGMF